METSTNRNISEARRIESWLLNRIALKGGTNVAKAIGVDKAQISRWKEKAVAEDGNALGCSGVGCC